MDAVFIELTEPDGEKVTINAGAILKYHLRGDGDTEVIITQLWDIQVKETTEKILDLIHEAISDFGYFAQAGIHMADDARMDMDAEDYEKSLRATVLEDEGDA